MQISPVMTSYTRPKMKKDISANLYQKCLILCSKILLNVLHRMSLLVWLPWQHTGFQTSPMHFWPHSAFHFDICKWCLICLIQQAYKNVSSSLWPRLMFCNLKITHIFKREWVAMETNIFIAVGVVPVEQLAYQVSVVCTANRPR